jgi:ribosomal protein S14
MLSSKIKDIKIRKLFNKIENKNTINKFLFYYLASYYKKADQENYLLFYANLFTKKNFYLINKTKTVNRCVLTNRNRSVLRPYKISRVILRELLQFGILPGFSKAVW